MLVIKQLIFGYGRLKIFLGMTDGIMMVARAGISIINLPKVFRQILDFSFSGGWFKKCLNLQAKIVLIFLISVLLI